MNNLDAAPADGSKDRSTFLSSYRALLKRVRQGYADPALHLELARFLIQHERLDRAFSSLRVARALQPRRAETHYLIGWVHQREGNVADAKLAYRQILELDPEDPQAHFHLGRLQEAEGDDPAAARSFRRVIAIDPSFAEAYWHLAQNYRRAGDHPKALKQLTVLRELQPGNHLVPYDIGLCYVALAVPDKAILAFQAALKLAPDHIASKLALASVYLEGKANAQALALLEEVVARWPRTPDAYLLLSRLHVATGKLPQALADLLQFQKIFPLDYRGCFEMGKLYSLQGDFELAESELGRALDMAPENLEIYTALAKVHDQTADAQKAIKLALLLCQRFPARAESFERLADVYERFERHAEGIEAIGRGLALEPRNDQLYCKRARLQIQAGNYNEAVLDFQKAREINPECPEAKLDTELIRGHKTVRKAFDLYTRGREAADRGDFQQALSIYRQVLQLVPDNVSWLRDMLDVFVSLGQFRDAGRTLESLQRLTPGDASLLRRSALFHYQLGNFELAFRLFEQAVGLDPDDAASRVHVLRSLGHRFLDHGLSPDRYPALLSAYQDNLSRARDVDLARLELGHFHIAVSRHVAAGTEWRRLARESLQAVGEGCSHQVSVWKLRGLYELALIEGHEPDRLALARRLAESLPDDPLPAVAYFEALLEGPTPLEEDRERANRFAEAHPKHGFLRALKMRLFRKMAACSPDAKTVLRREIRNCQHAVSEEPGGFSAFFELGLALRYLTLSGEWYESARKADIAFTKAAGLDPSSPWPWWALVKNAAGAPGGEFPGDRARLAAIAFKALRRFPMEPLIHYYAGESRIGSPDPAEQEAGLRELTCATVLSPEMSASHIELARHYARLGQTQAAHHHYLRVLEGLVGSRHAAEARAELSKLV